MPNMSYCRFENTYSDLMDCYAVMGMGDDQELSADEQKYRRWLIKLCCTIAAEYGAPQEEE
jgi:hypothetical protein